MIDTEALFQTAEQIVRCWANGIPSGCKALPIEREGGSGSECARAERLFVRSERYAVACAVMRRAEENGLQEFHVVVLLGLLVAGKSWDEVAEVAELEDERIEAMSVKKRVYRALHSGLRIIQGVM